MHLFTTTPAYYAAYTGPWNFGPLSPECQKFSELGFSGIRNLGHLFICTARVWLGKEGNSNLEIQTTLIFARKLLAVN